MIPERSKWIGLVCWGLIVNGMYNLYKALKALGTDAFQHSMTIFPYPSSVAYGIFFGGCVLMILSGACMYERLGWARHVYLVGVLPLFIQRWLEHHVAQQALLAHPPKVPHPDWQKYVLLLELLLYLLSAFILFTRSARRFYHPPLYIDE